MVPVWRKGEHCLCYGYLLNDLQPSRSFGRCMNTYVLKSSAAHFREGHNSHRHASWQQTCTFHEMWSWRHMISCWQKAISKAAPGLAPISQKVFVLRKGKASLISRWLSQPHRPERKSTPSISVRDCPRSIS